MADCDFQQAQALYSIVLDLYYNHGEPVLAMHSIA
jgi:hypothetical protein